MAWTNAQKGSVSVTMSSFKVMSGIGACWRSVFVAVASSDTFLLPLGVHSVAVFCPYRADSLFRWAVTAVVCFMAMLELMQIPWVSDKLRSFRLASYIACDAGTTAVVDDIRRGALSVK